MTQIDRNEILSLNPIEKVIQSYGVDLKKAGGELVGLCPFHKEKSPSFHVNPEKQTFHCFGCGVGGSVIDFVSKKENLSIKQTMEKLGKTQNENQAPKKESKIVAKYEYQDEQGTCLYKVFRFEPKDFRQAHQVNGKTVWSMEGIRRVLYRLPEIVKANNVIICEGEKDADRLASLGFQSTCNVGGAGKWLDGYTETLRGKSVTIIPDNDDAGSKHCDKVKESIKPHVKSLKVVKVPSEFKDVSEWADKCPQLTHKVLIQEWMDAANEIIPEIPIYSMDHGEKVYSKFVEDLDKRTLKFDWLPTLTKRARGLVPGDLAIIGAETGVGKTIILQNIAYHASPLKVLFFPLELSESMMFERFMQIRHKVSGHQIEQGFKQGIKLGTDEKLSHIFTCPIARQTPESVEKYIIQSELVIGERPQIVIVDYIGLVEGQGKSKYEKVTNVAEEFRKIAQTTQTIIIMASQVHRKEGEGGELFLHDFKDSGGIENSASFALVAWKEAMDKITLKIVKNSKGTSGWKIPCNFDGEHMTITESVAETKTLKY